jgi:hypothetical protein
MSSRHSSPQAARLNGVLTLRDISLYGVEAKNVTRTDQPPNLGFSMTLGDAVWGRLDSGIIVFLPLDVSIDHVVGEEHTKLATFTVALQLSYESSAPLPADAPVSDYVALASWMQAWPYFRAEIQALSSKLGFPPLVLPVLLPGQTADVTVREQPSEAPVPAPKAPARTKQKRAAR